MVNIKNGILRIKSNHTVLDYLIDGSFLALLCSIFAHNSTDSADTLIYQILFFSFFGLTIVKTVLEMLESGSLSVPLCTLWYTAFVLLSVASVIWAQYPIYCTVQLSRMLQCLIMAFCVARNYRRSDGCNKCLNLFIAASVYTLIFILIKTPFDDWFIGQIGAIATSQNANTVALIFSNCCVIAFFLAYYRRRKIFFLIFAAELLLVILTGSRKSIICATLGVALLLLLNFERKRYFLRLFIIFALLVGLAILIMENDSLYAAVGHRFDSMFDYYGGNKVADYSMFFRRRLINTSKDIFFRHPFLGIGANNFSAYLGQIYDINTYAHSNYYELLANLGIVGAISYYWFYVYLISKLSFVFRRNGNRFALLILVLVIMLAISDYGLVSYYSRFAHIFLAFAFVSTDSCLHELNSSVLEAKQLEVSAS